LTSKENVARHSRSIGAAGKPSRGVWALSANNVTEIVKL
jgi:hypothetical protein